MPLCNFHLIIFLAHPSRRLVGELIVYPWSASVRHPSSSSTISNMNISANCGPIATKFYLKHHWVGGKAALGFWPDRIRTLVSMATESSHRVIMEKRCLHFFSAVFHPITYMRAWMSLKFGQIQQLISMATDRVMMEKTVSPLFLGCFSSVPFHTCRKR